MASQSRIAMERSILLGLGACRRASSRGVAADVTGQGRSSARVGRPTSGIRALHENGASKIGFTPGNTKSMVILGCTKDGGLVSARWNAISSQGMPQTRLYSTSGIFTKKPYSKNAAAEEETEEHAATTENPHHEEQEREHVFTPMRERDTMDRLDSQQSHFMSLEEVSASSMQASEVPQNMASGDIDSSGQYYDGQHHQSTGGVSLSGVMQSNVPEPFQSNMRGTPTHMNMPGGGSKSQDKYLAGHIKDVHPSRQYSTSAISRVLPTRRSISSAAAVASSSANMAASKDFYYSPHADMQGPQGDLLDYSVRDVVLQDPCPQGVQGSDCEHFKEWLNNCVRSGHAGCEENLSAFRSGRKTMPEIFAEQEQLIRQVSAHGGGFPAHQQTDFNSVRHFSTNPSPAQKEGVSSKSVPVEGAGTVEKLGNKDKLKRAVKEYGGTVVVFHVGISLCSLGAAYLAVSSGLDVVGLLQKIGVGQAIVESKLATGTGTFVVAYAVHKVFAPARIATTLTCTPFIVRYLRRIGFLKPPKV